MPLTTYMADSCCWHACLLIVNSKCVSKCERVMVFKTNLSQSVLRYLRFLVCLSIEPTEEGIILC